MVGPFGGTTAATILQAIQLHPELLGSPLSLTVNYCAGMNQGLFEVQLMPVRTNRSTQHWTAAIVQYDEQGQASVTTTATAVTAVRRDTWNMSDTPMPKVPEPGQAQLWEQGKQLDFLKLYEMRPIGAWLPKQWDGQISDASLSRLWLRDRPLRPLDFCSLMAMSDIFFPRVWIRRATRVPAGTVSITTYFHAGPDTLEATGTGYLLGQAQAQEFRNGFFDQSAQLWNEAGTLLCTSHQIVYFKE